MAINLRNFGTLEGRLTRDPKVLKVESTGDLKVYITIAVRRNYKNRQGEYESDYIECQQYLNEAYRRRNEEIFGDELGILSRMKKGRYLTVLYSQTSESYEKDGEMVYNQYNRIEQIDPKDTNESHAKANKEEKKQPKQRKRKQKVEEKVDDFYEEDDFYEDDDFEEIDDIGRIPF